MKKRTSILVLSLFVISQLVYGQVGIGTIQPDPSSILDLASNSQGLLAPRMTTAQRDRISSPATGLLIYNTETSIFNFYKGGWKDFLTGFMMPINGGTGIANNNDSTLTLSGAYPTTIKITAATGVTLPTTGTLYGTTIASISSAQLLNSLTDETGTGSSVFSTSPTFTGVPSGPTAAFGTNTTQLATTGFVTANINRNKYSSVSGSSIISTSSATDVVADGMTLTPDAGIYVVTFNSQYAIDSVDKNAQSMADLKTVYNILIEKPATNSTHGSFFGNGETLTEGVYVIDGAGTIAGTLTLDSLGNPNAVFIFKIDGAFSSTAGTIINLINGASASHVFWVAEGAIGIGASSTMKGMLLSHNGAIGIGASSNIEGRMFTISGAIGIDNSIIAIPTYSSYINLGILSSIGLFSSNGVISNVGVSNITGDIGTNELGISGFDTATVNGTINLPGFFTNALATFSIYQNGVLIADSSRTRLFNVNTEDVSLQAITTIATGQTIDIRWKVNLGTITLKNRILTLINVR